MQHEPSSQHHTVSKFWDSVVVVVYTIIGVALFSAVVETKRSKLLAGGESSAIEMSSVRRLAPVISFDEALP